MGKASRKKAERQAPVDLWARHLGDLCLRCGASAAGRIWCSRCSRSARNSGLARLRAGLPSGCYDEAHDREMLAALLALETGY